MIPEMTARSPPTVTVRLETQVVEENVHGIIAQGIDVLHMVDHHDNRTQSIHKLMAICSHMIITFLRRDFSQLDSMKPVLSGQLSRRPGFMSACFRQALQPGSSNDGILSSLPTTMRNFERDRQNMLGIASFEHWLLDHTVDLNDPHKNKS